MALVTVTTQSPAGKEGLSRCLEESGILCFSESPLVPDRMMREVLLAQKPGHSRFHKNVAYRPETGRMGGVSGFSRAEREKIRRALEEYSRSAVEFVGRLLPDYASSWRVGYTSFRPYEEEGRPLRTRSRNDLMHFDAFPSRPTKGDRILRVFTNIHQTRPRIWISGGNFERLAERYAMASGILDDVFQKRTGGALVRLARTFGLGNRKRSPYDEFMLRFHHFLKENDDFQETAPREQFSFPPGSTWIVFTDGVSHAVLSGRHALEQTFLVARESLSSPERAPIAVLERLAGGRRVAVGRV